MGSLYSYQLTIAGIDVNTIAGVQWIASSFRKGSTANGRATLNVDIVSTDGSYIPALDATVAFLEGGVTIFGGTITDVVTTGAGNLPIVALASKITVTDYNGLADQRDVYQTIPAGTLKAALQALLPYLTPYGVTLDPAQVTGPALPQLLYDDRKLVDVFNELATLTGSNYVWKISATKVLGMYQIGTLAAPFNVVDGDGNSLRDITVQTSRTSTGLPYANHVIVRGGSPQVPIRADAVNNTEVAAHGVWDLVVAAPTATDVPTAQALANELLLAYVVTPQIVKYLTKRTGLAIGQTQTITRVKRGLNATFLITDIQTVVDQKAVLIHTITTISGSVYQGSWRDIYKQWSGGASQVTAVPGTAGAGRTAWFLGGSAIQYVQSPAPTWTPIDGTAADPGTQIPLDTVARGSATATVHIRLRARAGTVQARLRDLSNNLTVGTSAVVGTTTFTQADFSVTLTPGANIYRIELLPSVPNTDVAAIAFLE